MHSAPGTISVVDDDADVRKAIGRLLRLASYEVRTYGSAVEFIHARAPDTPSCVLLDFIMPDLNGLEVQAYLAASGHRCPIIFLTGAGTIDLSVAAMRAGALNFLTKPVEGHSLLSAVAEAMRIDTMERDKRAHRQAVQRRLGTLTPRERQVLEHVVAGRLNKQIAADLGTVEKTIKVHRARVMQKMGVRALAHLVQLVASVGIGSGPVPFRVVATDTSLPNQIEHTTLSTASKWLALDGSRRQML